MNREISVQRERTIPAGCERFTNAKAPLGQLLFHRTDDFRNHRATMPQFNHMTGFTDPQHGGEVVRFHERCPGNPKEFRMQ